MAFLNETGLTRYDGKLKNLMAAAYSTSATYAVGDYCIHGGSLYRCTAAIESAEAWTAAHWTKVNLGDEIDSAKEDLEKLKLDVADAYSASDSHAVGDYVVRNGVLYRCTTAIGSGGETWNAAHWTVVNIGDELVAIKADIGILKEDLADAYSSSKTYAVGDYCLKDGVLYRCTSAISTAEAWTSGHWTAVQVGEELCELNSAITSVKNSITPYTEANTTATRNYAVNDFIYIYGNLYVVTNPITQGQTISTQTNVQAINIAECLYPATISSSATETLAGLENNGTLNYNTLVARNGLVNIGYRRSGMTTPVIGNGNILQLPTNLRPKVQQRMVGLAIENGVQIHINLAIQTTGYVYYYRSNSSNITEILIVGNYFI